MMVKADVAGFAPGVIEGGENWQVAPSGMVEELQASKTALWNPFCAVAVMVKRAGVPGSRVKAPDPQSDETAEHLSPLGRQ